MSGQDVPRGGAGPRGRQPPLRVRGPHLPDPASIGRGDDALGNPRRAHFFRFELFELVLLLKLDRQFPVEQFEATGSASPLLFKQVGPLIASSHGPWLTSGVWEKHSSGEQDDYLMNKQITYIHTYIYIYIYIYIL